MLCELIEGKIKFKREDIKSLSVKAIDGSTFSICNNHEPFISLIGNGNITILFKEGSKKEVFSLKSGVVKIQSDYVKIISFGKLKRV